MVKNKTCNEKYINEQGSKGHGNTSMEYKQKFSHSPRGIKEGKGMLLYE